MQGFCFRKLGAEGLEPCRAIGPFELICDELAGTLSSGADLLRRALPDLAHLRDQTLKAGFGPN